MKTKNFKKIYKQNNLIRKSETELAAQFWVFTADNFFVNKENFIT